MIAGGGAAVAGPFAAPVRHQSRPPPATRRTPQALAQLNPETPRFLPSGPRTLSTRFGPCHATCQDVLFGSIRRGMSEDKADR